MALSIGTKLGTYEILAPIGAGGMGEVYRARDTRLGREVAIKVLPDAFARDPERLARFEREAQLLAALNHPNIAAIYGLEEHNGARYLVLEYVPGETLLAGKAFLPIDEALVVCAQIAEALEAAHEKGIVHRDLKPANVKITPEGKVKVLDFGLAKDVAMAGSAADLSKSPTITSPAYTRAGMIMGTAAYMSPEQARGKSIDRRTDNWAFGCVLYECLAGRQAFTGETVSDTISSILRADPDWNALPAATPANVKALLRRCLQKQADKRLQHIGDARIELEEAHAANTTAIQFAAPGGMSRRTSRTQLIRWSLLALVVGAVIAGAAVWFWKSAQSVTGPVTRLAATLPSKLPMSLTSGPDVALSPDGRRLVYVSRVEGKLRLCLRALDQFDVNVLPGTEGASSPFFSPDGQWIAFFSDAKLKKVAISGGTPLVICDAPGGIGGAWRKDDAIFFTSDWAQGISRVPAGGGKAEAVTRPDAQKGEISHNWPELLPDGDHLLFSLVVGPGEDETSVALLSLKTGKWSTLIEKGRNAHYLATGVIVFARGNTLLAAPFDIGRLTVTGAPVPVLDGVIGSGSDVAAEFSVSANGVLAYAPGGAVFSQRSMIWVDRGGVAKPVTQTERAYEDLSLSPDGRQVALTVEGPAWNIWVYDLARGTLTRLTFDKDNRDPLWTPDSKRVIYSSFRDGQYGMYWKPADSSGPEERLVTSPYWIVPDSCSPDGRYVTYTERHPQTGTSINYIALQGDRKPQAFIQSQFLTWFSAFSPDGKWIAYSSSESGREEIYVQAFPGPGGKFQISTDGGTRPSWNANGKELFYRQGDKMMSVPVQTQAAFQAGAPRALFERHYFDSGHDYAFSPDGQRVIMLQESEQRSPVLQLNMILNWPEELKQRAH